jgi:hypothetical protein
MKKMNFKTWIEEARAKDKDGVLSGFSDKRLNSIMSRWHLANEWDADKFLFYIKQGRSVRIADVIFFDGFTPILVLFISGICVVFTVPIWCVATFIQAYCLRSACNSLLCAFWRLLFGIVLVDVFQATPVYAEKRTVTHLTTKKRKRETKQSDKRDNKSKNARRI